jgi:hypothetical protein
MRGYWRGARSDNGNAGAENYPCGLLCHQAEAEIHIAGHHGRVFNPYMRKPTCLGQLGMCCTRVGLWENQNTKVHYSLSLFIRFIFFVGLSSCACLLFSLSKRPGAYSEFP